MINLDHEIIRMFVKDNIYWKVLGIQTSSTFVRPCHLGADSEAMPSSAHSKTMSSSAYYYQPRSLNNNIFRQRQHFLKGYYSYRLVALSWGLPSSSHGVWINTINTAILKTPVQKFEKAIFLFRRTHEAAVRENKILAAIKRWLRRSNCGTKGQRSNLRVVIPQHSVLSKIIPPSRGQD